jgi:adenylate cyclase
MKSILEKISGDKKLFETEFLEALLGNERLRARLLVYVLIFVTVSILILYKSFSLDYNSLFQSYQGILVLIISIFILVVYELSIWYLLGKSKNPNRIKTQVLRYINSFIEISIPSILLIFLSLTSNSKITLVSPVLVTYFLIIILSTLRLNFWLSLFSGILASLEYILIYMLNFSISFDKTSILSGDASALYIGWGLMLIGAGLAAGFVAEQIKIRFRQYFMLNHERNQIINLFGQQVSHSIVDILLKQKPDLTSKQKNVTVMFLDIRGFTPFAEKNPPEVVVGYLNSLFSIMIEVINQHHGIINQFLGDGFMATFGAPLSHGNDSANCVHAARAIVNNVSKAVAEGKIPATRLGIGIHTGPAITGNIGTSHRKQYSITGNVVILASRIEQLNKQFGSQILLSDEIRQAANLKDQDVENVGPIMLKGRSDEIVLYKIV